MNLKKKISALLLVFTLVLTIFAVPVCAEGETYTITYTQPTGATVSFSIESTDTGTEGVHTYSFPVGTPVTVTVTAESGYKLSSVVANSIKMQNVSGQSTFSYEFDSNTTLDITTVAIQKAAISVNSSDLFTYTLEGADENKMAEIGSTVVLKITPVADYAVTKILFNGTEVTPGNEYSFTVADTNNIEVTAEQIVSQKVSLTANVTGDGSVSPNNESFDVGSAIQLSLSAGAGYILSSLNINGTDIPLSQVVSNKYSFTITENTTVNAVFKKSVILTVTVGTGGTALVNGITVTGSSTIKLAEGSDVKVTIAAKLGYTLDTVKVDNAAVTLDAESSYLITGLTTNKKVAATFKASTATQFIINASCDSNGTIFPEGDVPVDSGASKTFTITPNTGFVVDTVKVDGETVSIVNNTYTFEGVTSARNIYVTFKASGTDAKNPIGVSDVNWNSAEKIIIDISEQQKVAAEVLQKITSDCKDKVVVFQATNYRWTLPKGAEISTTYAFADFAIAINGGSNYNTIKNLLNSKVEDINFTLVTTGKTVNFPKGTEIGVKLGNEYANSDVQELFYISADNELKSPAGTNEVALVTVSSDGWVNINYDNNSDIILCKPFEGVYKIASSASAGGIITPKGELGVQTGGEKSYEITADEGYVISSLLVDGAEVTEALGQTKYVYDDFKNVSKDHTIAAKFMVKADYDASVSNNGGGSSALVVSLIIIFLAVAGAATLFIIKWRQEKY